MREKGVSGGSSDIKPEPNGLQNGTAPLQNALTKKEQYFRRVDAMASPSTSDMLPDNSVPLSALKGSDNSENSKMSFDLNWPVLV